MEEKIMKNMLTFATATAIALMLAAPVHAQAELVGNKALNDRIEDIQDDVTEDLARGEDTARFGKNGFAQGWSGSASLGMSATSGNTDTADLSFGGRVQYGAGLWNQSLGFAGQIAEDGGVRNKEELFATYEANRHFTDQFYMFGLGRAGFDGFSSDRLDTFLGFGPGLRAANTENLTWRVQAGPGARYTRDQMGNTETDVAAIASSRLFFRITDVAFLSNDTDILHSDINTVISNDAGVTFKMTDALSTRVAYRTEYNTEPAFGRLGTDNTLGASLVYGF